MFKEFEQDQSRPAPLTVAPERLLAEFNAGAHTAIRSGNRESSGN